MRGGIASKDQPGYDHTYWAKLLQEEISPDFKAAAEPIGALRGGQVGEKLGTNVSSGHLLQTVVAYSGNGLHAGGDIGWINDVALLSGMAPDTCQAVSLQFHSYGQWVGGFGIVPPQAADLLFDTEQLLHVMADFMGDHICSAEFDGRAQAVGKFVEKPEIQVNLFVQGTIERGREEWAAPHADVV